MTTSFASLSEMMKERQDLYVEAGEVRWQVNREDGPIREGLQEQISRLSSAIEVVRELPGDNTELHDTLIECIQFANKERASNRRRVKSLSNRLTTLKNSINHISRSISNLGTKLKLDV